MYEHMTAIRPLDFIILSLIALAIIFSLITYAEVIDLRSTVARMQFEETK